MRIITSLMRRILFFLLALIPLSAAGQPVYDCHRTTGKIKIDGKVTDKEWAAAVPCTDFRDIRGDGWAAPKYLTTMRMLWDDDNLYVSAVLEEPDVKVEETEFDLSVAQRLASKIGGYLRFDETYTRGTRMEFVLPVR